MSYIFWIVALLSLLYIVANIGVDKKLKFEMQLKKLVPKIYYAIFTITLCTFSIHLFKLLIDDFSIAYVYKYSTINQPLLYKIAATCSGEGGAFVLWLTAATVVGLFLIKTVSYSKYKYIASAIFGFLPLILSIILIFIAPFESTLSKFPELNSIPKDGLGLNPILQSPYNLLHPPLIFISFSILYVPFVLSLSSLLKRQYFEWQKSAITYNSIALCVFSVALIFGSVWAYNSFGWGGFWGWDPIENAALIPFIFSIILLHCLVIYRKTNGLIKTTYIFSLLTFPFINFCSFLARSGKNNFASMHTYAQSGENTYYILFAVFVFAIALCFVLVSLRSKEINKLGGRLHFNFLSREMFITLGCLMLFAIIFVLLIGTCFPFFAPFLNKTDVSITSDFYLAWVIPPAIIYFTLLAVSMFLNWKENDFNKIANRIIPTFALSLLIMIFGFYNAINRIEYLLLVFACSFTILSHIEVIVRNYNKIHIYPSCLTHIGIAMFIFASMLCGNFEQSKIITLESDKTVKLFDNYSAKFIYFEKQIFNSHSNIVAKIEVYDSNKTYTFSPSFSYKNNEKKFIMPLLLPSVQHDGTNDIYISPLFHSVDTQMEYNILIQNEKRSAKIDKNIFIKLLNINKNNAIIEIDNLQQKDTMSLTLELKNEKKDNYLWYNLPNSNYQIALTEFFAKENNEENKVIVIYKEVDSNLPEPIEIVKIEFSTKPYMFFVWLGLSIFVFGLFLNCLLPFHHKNY